MKAIRRPLAPLAAALLAAVLVALLVLVAAPRGAAAHDGEGILVVETAEAEGTSIHYVVRLTWANDGHAALGATLTATVLGPGGATGAAPVQLTSVDQDGRYEGTVAFPDPGDWTVRFVAIEPETRFDRAQPVAAPPTTAAPTTTVAETTTTAEPGDPGEAEATDDAEEIAAAGPADTDDGGFPVVPALIGLLLVGAVAGGVVYARRARPA
jgi:hypothetical protein